ncbi:SCP2 sterol-binding domain-containing protein [Holophaga foetida]|uniref:SCP2 sterol-binding domain-containing protein n=1 Tax=Holophaga foetida TaxID=35839 RepID=UPI0002473B61|nr:SCP2 sterol-binding domain-containing protein [Holophaga foetida]
MAHQTFPELVAEFRGKLARNPEKVVESGLQGVMQFDFREDGAGQFHVIFDQGKATLVEGGHPAPTFTVTAPHAIFDAMHAGELTHDEAGKSGKLKAAGLETFGQGFGKLMKSLS